MPRYSLAVVVFCLMVSGAAGVALHYARQDAAVVRGVEESAAAGSEAVMEAGAPASRAGILSAEAGEGAGAGTGVSAQRAGRRASGVSGWAERRGRIGQGSMAGRGYVRVSRREVAGGGPGVMGHTVRGVKKTGVVIGKTFGKIGGVFHD